MEKKIAPKQSRITLDISQEYHKKLKMLAAILGKSMREIIIDAIEKQLQHEESNNNTAIIKSIK